MRWLLCIAALLNSCSHRGSKEDSTPSLRVMTFNIHFSRSADYADTQTKIEDYLRDSKADFVLLQEVDKGTRRSLGRDQFALFQEKSNYPYGHYESAIPWDGGLFGLAILARHPIEILKIISMEAPIEQRGSDYEKRIAIVAKAIVAGRSVILVCTHLHYEDPARVTMAAQLRTGLAPFLNDQDTVIFGGDMNLLPTEALLATVSEGFTDSWTAMGLDPKRTRVDYIFTRNAPKPLSVVSDANGLSDHPAYTIRLPWP